MAVLGLSGLWLAALTVALGASEQLVRSVSTLGHRWQLSAALIGLLVAAGADGPEVTSALVALGQGSTTVGVGVVIGSNIFNLAGLLGLSALLANRVGLGRQWLSADAALNLVATLLIGALILDPDARIPLSIALLVVFVLYVWDVAGSRGTLARALRVGTWPAPDYWGGEAPADRKVVNRLRYLLISAGIAVAAIVGASEILVRTSLDLAGRLSLPSAVVGTVLLAVATSLPNAWAAVSLARRQMAAAAIASTFNSNTINLVAALALPSLFVRLQLDSTTRTFDIWWLAGMTLVSVLMLGYRHTLDKVEGSLLVALYLGFLVIHLVVFR